MDGPPDKVKKGLVDGFAHGGMGKNSLHEPLGPFLVPHCRSDRSDHF